MNIERQFVLKLIIEAGLNSKRTGIPNVLEDDLARDTMVCPLLFEAVAAALLSCSAIFVAENTLRILSMLIVSSCVSV